MFDFGLEKASAKLTLAFLMFALKQLKLFHFHIHLITKRRYGIDGFMAHDFISLLDAENRKGTVIFLSLILK